MNNFMNLCTMTTQKGVVQFAPLTVYLMTMIFFLNLIPIVCLTETSKFVVKFKNVVIILDLPFRMLVMWTLIMKTYSMQ